MSWCEGILEVMGGGMVLNMELTPGEFALKLIIPQSSGQLESDLFFCSLFWRATASESEVIQKRQTEDCQRVAQELHETAPYLSFGTTCRARELGS